MKGILSLFFCLILIPNMVCAAAYRDYDPDLYGDLNIRYNYSYAPAVDSGGVYLGIRGDLSFLSWTNDYVNQTGEKLGGDSFDFKPVIGLDVSLGYKIDDKWRADLEMGYIGKYSEAETEHYSVTERTDFKLETFYFSVNGYYDFKYGLYAGAGLGIALVELGAESSIVPSVNETKVSPLGAIMFGWTYELDENIDLDLRYRLAVFDAGSITLSTGVGTWVTSKTDMVSDNSLSIGIRYSF